jgi:hypothetical protein
MAPKLAELMQQERERLGKRREELATEMAQIDAELARIDAYFSAGKPARPAKGDRQSRGSVQAAVLGIIQKVPAGISRGDIIATMEATGSKASEQSISNALSALKKADKITSRDGKYVAAASDTRG